MVLCFTLSFHWQETANSRAFSKEPKRGGSLLDSVISLARSSADNHFHWRCCKVAHNSFLLHNKCRTIKSSSLWYYAQNSGTIHHCLLMHNNAELTTTTRQMCSGTLSHHIFPQLQRSKAVTRLHLTKPFPFKTWVVFSCNHFPFSPSRTRFSRQLCLCFVNIRLVPVPYWPGTQPPLCQPLSETQLSISFLSARFWQSLIISFSGFNGSRWEAERLQNHECLNLVENSIKMQVFSPISGTTKVCFPTDLCLENELLFQYLVSSEFTSQPFP